MITGTIALRMPNQDSLTQDRDGAALAVLNDLPDGVRVVVDVHDRTYFTDSVPTLLKRHGERLDIEIIGANCKVVGWVIRAARTGAWPPSPWPHLAWGAWG